MITNLECDTLQKRRDLVRLNMMCRIVHALVGIPVEPYLTPSTSIARGHEKNSLFRQSLGCGPDNTGSLPEPAGGPHLLNATPCFIAF